MITTFLFRLSIFLGFIIVLAILIFGYLFFEPFLTESVVTIKVVNTERWGNEKGKYFIFTKDEVFLNSDDYYHNKNNSDEIYPEFKKGYTYKVKVIGIYMPFIARFRNIINIIETTPDEFSQTR
jgi:hypothetical protein